MSIHMYLDAELTEPISEGDMTSPDSDTYDGADGESKDRRIWIANEQASLVGDVLSNDNTIQISVPAFGDGDYLIVDDEIVKVVFGGGTTLLAIERGALGTVAASHVSSSRVYAAVRHTDLVIAPVDIAQTSETGWCALALTEESLDQATPGMPLDIGDKAYDQTLTFWRRITVPPGTPLQNKTDLKLRLTGTEHLVTL